MIKHLESLKKIALTGLVLVTNRAITFYKIEIPLNYLQHKVEEQFPFTRKKYLLSMTLTDPVVRLEETTNRIGLELTVCLDIPGAISTQRRGLIYGSLDYDRENGEFYFLNLTIHELDSNGISNRKTGIVYDALETVLNKAFASTPIYRLQEEDLKHSLTRLLLKSVIIRKDRIIVELSLY